MKKILNENTKALCYLLMGILISFVLSFKFIDKINFEKERKLVYLNQLFSCQQSLFSKGNKSNSFDQISEFCEKQATDAMNGYVDLSQQLEKINDKNYSWLVFGE